jgi:hypothetical protein
MNDPLEPSPGERPADRSAEQRLAAREKLVHPMVVEEPPPLRWRECLAIVLLVVLCDLTIYRGHGFAGSALLFFAAPFLLAIGSPRPRCGVSSWLLGAMLVVLAIKLVWCGSALLVAAGFGLVAAYAAALSGMSPYVIEVGVFASQVVLAGYDGLIHYWRCIDNHSPSLHRTKWLNVVLPLVALAAFGLLFILANPNLLTLFGKGVEWLGNVLREYILDFAPSLWEVVFWIAVLWVVVGLLRPLVKRMSSYEQSLNAEADEADETAAAPPAPMYPAFRNTLVTVILLFVVYLAFEFNTLWFCVFPKGFYYSGYAHEGAAWLTVALALATGVLSLVFKGSVLRDPNLPTLRRLAWLWSFENILLAAAVYHRLYIYIGFNGMTFKRMIGIFGMSAVVVGFVLVVWKIVHNRDFIWLFRRHLWTLAIATYLFAIMPVDMIVTRYNVARILSGDPAPSVQISEHPEHPLDSEGVVQLLPLLDCKDATIREGIAAMLAQRQAEARTLATERQKKGWTTFQLADRSVLESLDEAGNRWKQYTAAPARRDAAFRRFRDYAYQWY